MMASSTPTITGSTTPGKVILSSLSLPHSPLKLTLPQPILLYVSVFPSTRPHTPAIGFTHDLHPSTTLGAFLTSLQSRIPDVILTPLLPFYQQYALPRACSDYTCAKIAVFDPAHPALLHEVLNLNGEPGLDADTDVWQVLNGRLRCLGEGEREMYRYNVSLLFIGAPERVITVPWAAAQMMYYRGMLWTSPEPVEDAGLGREESGDGFNLLMVGDQDDATIDAED
jgi:hypothetical protein